ncbi:MAG: PstS family phosphate ABC transporter substrate-binding protein [Ahrensia sp.]|nr:PstS family phosphate ABC transporter substrate-binding protein [Ahrensia sp.]
MFTNTLKLTTAALALTVALPTFAFAQAAEPVQVDGSSTVFPISEAFAEEYQKATGNRVVVGVSGTGGGFKKFCRGEISLTGASRPIKTSEAEDCKANNVEFVELPIAIDALAVIVHPENPISCMSVAEIKTMYETKAQGVITKWNQVNPAYPDANIGLFGAGTDSGTYDYFTFAMLGEEGASRGDYTATEDDNITIQGVSGDPLAIGFLGLAYVEENRGKIKPLEISMDGGPCVAPTTVTASDGTYQPLTRPLFMYVNKEHLTSKANVEAFANYMFDGAVAEELVASTGYLALPERAFTLGQAKIAARKTGSFFDGGSKVGVTVDELLAAN